MIYSLNLAPTQSPWQLSLSQALKSLVDYDEDSDEEEKSEDQAESPAKRKKLDDT